MNNILQGVKRHPTLLPLFGSISVEPLSIMATFFSSDTDSVVSRLRYSCPNAPYYVRGNHLIFQPIRTQTKQDTQLMLLMQEIEGSIQCSLNDLDNEKLCQEGSKSLIKIQRSAALNR